MIKAKHCVHRPADLENVGLAIALMSKSVASVVANATILAGGECSRVRMPFEPSKLWLISDRRLASVFTSFEYREAESDEFQGIH